MNVENMTRQNLFLENLNDSIAIERAKLVDNMRSLARRLADEADRLTGDPKHLPSTNGYVACISTSEDIDNGSVRLATMIELRGRLWAAYHPEIVATMEKALKGA